MQINDNYGKIMVVDDQSSQGEVDAVVYAGEEIIIYTFTRESAEELIRHLKSTFEI